MASAASAVAVDAEGAAAVTAEAAAATDILLETPEILVAAVKVDAR